MHFGAKTKPANAMNLMISDPADGEEGDEDEDDEMQSSVSEQDVDAEGSLDLDQDLTQLAKPH